MEETMEKERRRTLPDEYPPPKGTFKTLYKDKWYYGTRSEQQLQIRVDDLTVKCGTYRFTVVVLAVLTFWLLTAIVVLSSL